MYEDQEANREAQRELIDDKQDKERRDDIKRMEKLEERNGNTANVILQMIQQMYPSQPSGQVIAPVSSAGPQQQQQQIQ